MTLSSRSRCQSRRIGTASCLALALLLSTGPVCAAQAPEESITEDTTVTVRDASGKRWCATVVKVHEGADGNAWAWVRFIANPLRIEHLPVREVERGCSP
jgi:hypothetical protein